MNQFLHFSFTRSGKYIRDDISDLFFVIFDIVFIYVFDIRIDERPRMKYRAGGIKFKYSGIFIINFLFNQILIQSNIFLKKLKKFFYIKCSGVFVDLHCCLPH